MHRISNRLGWVQTTLPEETEQALYKATDAALVALHQPVSGDLGTERLPAGVPALRRLRDRRRLSKNWCGQEEAMKRTACVWVAVLMRGVGVGPSSSRRPRAGGTGRAAAAGTRCGGGAGSRAGHAQAVARRGAARHGDDRARQLHLRDLSERGAQERRAHPGAREAQLLQRPAHQPGGARIRGAVRRPAVAGPVEEGSLEHGRQLQHRRRAGGEPQAHARHRRRGAWRTTAMRGAATASCTSRCARRTSWTASTT